MCEYTEYTSPEVEMSYHNCEGTEYLFILYSDANRKKIHKIFEINIEHDCVSTHIHNVWQHTIDKHNTNLDAVKFICTQEIDESVKFSKGEIIVNGFYIRQASDLLKKLDAINGNSPVFDFDESKYKLDYQEYITFNSTHNIPLILEQINMLITELKEVWNNEDFIEHALNIDFENSGQLDSSIDEEGESKVFSILAFLKYAFNYIMQNPAAEFYYAYQYNDWPDTFDTFEELSETVESLFK